ncbi:MAG: WD40/YVTN/BNR-like repeat-containing protein [Thermoanaerobaculia bacterium]
MLQPFRRVLIVLAVAVFASLSAGPDARARTIDGAPVPGAPVRRFYTPVVDAVLGAPGGRTYARASDRPPNDSRYQLSFWWTRAPGEERWTLLNGQPSPYYPWILAPDPARPDTVYAVDILEDVILRSQDAGATWQTRGPLPGDTELPQLLVAGDELLLLDYDRCLPCRSRDGGKTWEPGTAEAPGDLVPAPGDPRVFYTVSPYGIFRSSDGARSYTDVSPARGEGAAELALADANTVYALAVDPGGFLSRTRDGGATWTRLSPPKPRLIWSGLAVHPRSALHLAILGGPEDPSLPRHLFESFDGGDSWTMHTGPLNAASLRFAVSPGGEAIEAFGRRGLFTTRDFGETWKLADQGIMADADLLLAGTSKGYLYVSALENGTLWRSRNGGRDWELRGTQRLVALWIDPFNPDALAALNATDYRLLWSDDGGKTWIPRPGPETAGGPTGVGRLSFDPHQRDKVYAATREDGWVSTDRGITWRILTATLPSGSDCNLYSCWETRDVEEVVPDPLQPSRLYVRALSGYIYFRTDDGGATWKQFEAPALAASDSPRLLPDPKTTGRVFWGLRSEAQVYESRDAGNPPWKTLLRTVGDIAPFSTETWFTFDPQGRLFVAPLWHSATFLRRVGADWEHFRIGVPYEEDVALQEPLLPLPAGGARVFLTVPGLGLFRGDLPR